MDQAAEAFVEAYEEQARVCKMPRLHLFVKEWHKSRTCIWVQVRGKKWECYTLSYLDRSLHAWVSDVSSNRRGANRHCNYQIVRTNVQACEACLNGQPDSPLHSCPTCTETLAEGHSMTLADIQQKTHDWLGSNGDFPGSTYVVVHCFGKAKAEDINQLEGMEDFEDMVGTPGTCLAFFATVQSMSLKENTTIARSLLRILAASVSKSKKQRIAVAQEEMTDARVRLNDANEKLAIERKTCEEAQPFKRHRGDAAHQEAGWHSSGAEAHQWNAHTHMAVSTEKLEAELRDTSCTSLLVLDEAHRDGVSRTDANPHSGCRKELGASC